MSSAELTAIQDSSGSILLSENGLKTAAKNKTITANPPKEHICENELGEQIPAEHVILVL